MGAVVHRAAVNPEQLIISIHYYFRISQAVSYTHLVADAIFNGGLVGENGAPGSNSDIITVDGDRAFVLRISEHKAEAVKPPAVPLYCA